MQEFSAFAAHYGAEDSIKRLRSLVATLVSAMGYGTDNRVRYSNPIVDNLLTEALTTMDDELPFSDLGLITDQFSFVRSSLREAGAALIAELIRQCEHGGPGRGTMVPTIFHVQPGMNASVLDEPMPKGRG